MEGQVLTLGYWDIRGLCQPIKYLLEYLKVPYTLKQYTYGEAPDHNIDGWLSAKHTLGLPFPNLPYLLDGDVSLTESQAILRYLCAKYQPDLLGKSLLDRATVDMVLGVSADLRKTCAGVMYDKHGDREWLKKYIVEGVQGIIKHLEGGRTYVAGDYVTFVDFFLMEQVELFEFVCEGVVHGTLREYRERVAALPGLKEYLASDRCIKRYFMRKYASINN
jgi:glutathione S-transferase